MKKLTHSVALTLPTALIIPAFATDLSAGAIASLTAPISTIGLL